MWGAKADRELSILPGYPAQYWRPRYLPSAAIDALSVAAEPGDLVAFMSNKPNLDTFHVGLLVPSADAPIAVRHASRSDGRVVHADLAEFLADNDVPGMFVVRPHPA